MSVETLYSLYLKHPKIVTDSRKAEKGSIFFALKGDNFDGNDFAAQALQSGCNCAVVDRPAAMPEDKRYIVVDNVLTALQNLAGMYREKLNIPVIAITGTNGKTTTKELVKCVLSSGYEVYATSGNLNNHIGVPLTLLSIPRQAQVAIVEMGASHPGEIRELCRIAMPDYGLITNIGKGHLEGFGGFEGVKQTKKELYDYIEKHIGTIFYNAENELLAGMLRNTQADTVSYGMSGHSDCWGEITDASPYLRMKLHIGANSFDVTTQLAGVYNFENLIAAACIGNYFNIPPDRIACSLAGYTPQNNRSQIVNTDRNRLLLDYYNANPTSMEQSLKNFFEYAENAKMVILGDMFELGDAAQQEHEIVVEQLRQHPGTVSIVTGKQFYGAARNVPEIRAFETTEDLQEWIKNNPPEGKFILLKGSRAMKLEKLVGLL
jgi:UDP-N-acetylmuramoyl-tripeptide--D-alanyl-D-alanine ligase